MPIVKLLNAGTVGLIKDVPAWEAPNEAWSDASNVRFKNGMIERVPGHQAGYGTPGHAPYGLFMASDGSGNRYIVYPGLTAIRAVAGTTHYDITRSVGGAYGATADLRWTGGVLGGIVIVNNSVDDPQYWVPQAGGNMALLTNWPATTKCKVLRPFLSYLVAFDITEGSTRYPQRVKWSAEAATGSVPSSWDETDATKDSGEYDLGEGQDFIMDALQLGPQLAIYREQSIYLMRWIGGNEIFAFNRVPNTDYGALTNNCIASFPSGHVVLGNGDVYVFNGTTMTSILDGRMRRYLFNTMDSTNRKRSFVVTNVAESEVWICFPTTSATSCDRALIWNWKDNTLSLRDLPNATCGVFGSTDQSSPDVWSADSAAWSADTTTWNYSQTSLASQRLVIGTTASKLMIVGIDNSFDGTAPTAVAERTGITLGDAQAVKRVLAVYPRIDGTVGQTVGVSVGVAMNSDENYTWSSEQSYTIGSSRKVDVRCSGRFIGLRLRSTSTVPWRLQSADVDVVTAGRR